MKFQFIDSNNWEYEFDFYDYNNDSVLGELMVEVTLNNRKIHIESLTFNKETGKVKWSFYHLRKGNPLISEEGRNYCEQLIRLKAFW